MDIGGLDGFFEEILLAPGMKEDQWSPEKRRAGIKTFYNLRLGRESRIETT